MNAVMIIRADASADIGAGHVMRCLALAQAWQEQGGTVLFAMQSVPSPLRIRLKHEQVKIQPIQAKANSNDDCLGLIKLAQQHQAAWVVVDGYVFDHQYQEAVKNAGFRLLWIDDYGHAKQYGADIVLNQIPGGDKTLYRHRSVNTELMIGNTICIAST